MSDISIGLSRYPSCISGQFGMNYVLTQPRLLLTGPGLHLYRMPRWQKPRIDRACDRWDNDYENGRKVVRHLRGFAGRNDRGAALYFGR